MVIPFVTVMTAINRQLRLQPGLPAAGWGLQHGGGQHPGLLRRWSTSGLRGRHDGRGWRGSGGALAGPLVSLVNVLLWGSCTPLPPVRLIREGPSNSRCRDPCIGSSGKGRESARVRERERERERERRRERKVFSFSDTILIILWDFHTGLSEG